MDCSPPSRCTHSHIWEQIPQLQIGCCNRKASVKKEFTSNDFACYVNNKRRQKGSILRSAETNVTSQAPASLSIIYMFQQVYMMHLAMGICPLACSISTLETQVSSAATSVFYQLHLVRQMQPFLEDSWTTVVCYWKPQSWITAVLLGGGRLPLRLQFLLGCLWEQTYCQQPILLLNQVQDRGYLFSFIPSRTLCSAGEFFLKVPQI